MTFDTEGLLKLLTTPPPEFISAVCVCGASVESIGRDESSRAWVEAWKVAHICIKKSGDSES